MESVGTPTVARISSTAWARFHTDLRGLAVPGLFAVQVTEFSYFLPSIDSDPVPHPLSMASSFER